MASQDQNIDHSEIKNSSVQQSQAGRDAVSFNNSHDNRVVIENTFLRLFDRSESNQVDWDWAKLLLEKKQLPEIRKRLTDTLGRERILMDVSIAEQQQWVNRLQADRQIQVNGKNGGLLDPNKMLIETFGRDDISGKLLILGAPGSGKTTALLSLAEQLVIGAIEKAQTVIPVILELPTWREDNQSIEAWIIEQLYDLHGGNRKRKIYEQWLERQVLLPLLDGLDELGLERQKKCTEKLNEFARTYPQLVVCCRVKEFETANIKLSNLNGAICLQKLSDGQIEAYFQSINRADLWSEMKTNSVLQGLLQATVEGEPGLLRVPLFIKLLANVYDPQEPIKSKADLLEKYIERQLFFAQRERDHRKGLQNHPWAYKTVEKEPRLDETINSLSWVARQLQTNNKVDFLIEGIQPQSIEKFFMSRYKFVLKCFLFFTLMIMCLFMLNDLVLKTDFHNLKDLFFFIFSFFSVCFMFTYAFEEKFGHDKIYTQEVIFIIFSKIRRKVFWKAYISECSRRVLFWIQPPFTKFKIFFLSLIIGMTLASSIRDNNINVLNGLIFISSLYFLMCAYALFDVLRDLQILDDMKIRDYPNQGIWWSLASFLIIFVLITFLDLISEQIGINMSLFSSTWALFFLGCGGLICVKHFSLRFVLWQSGTIPWNFARFLNYCVERRLLLRVGGRYRFLHRELLDHFAQLPPGTQIKEITLISQIFSS